MGRKEKKINKLFSFRVMIILSVFLLYFIFSNFLFFIFNGYYIDNIKKKYYSDNYKARDLAKNYISSEMNRLSVMGAQAASDRVLFINIRDRMAVKEWDAINAKIITEPISRVKFTKIASGQKQRVFTTGYGTDESGLEMFGRKASNNEEMEMLGYSTDFSRKYLDKGDENFLKDALRNTGTVSLSRPTDLVFIQKKEDKIFIKSVSSVGRFLDGILLQFSENVPGLVVIIKTINHGFLGEIKSIINRDAILVYDDKIMVSTIYEGEKRISEFPIDKNTMELIKNKREATIVLNNAKMNFSFINLDDYDRKIVGYLGVGFDTREMEKISRENGRNFMIYEIIFSSILFVILMILLNFVFAPFNKIIKMIKAMKAGGYKNVEINSYYELEMLADSINTLIELVESREKELKELNINLEGIVEDRTEALQNALEKLKNTQEQLIVNEKLASVGKLAGGIAHEVNNPLGAIMASTQMLKADLLALSQKNHDYSEDIIDNIATIELGVKQVSDITSKLMTYAKTEKDFDRIDISTLLQNIAGKKEEEFKRAGICFARDIQPGKTIIGKKSELVEVFECIITNAKDAVLKKGGIEKKVSICLMEINGRIIVEIEDNGIGIEEEEKMRIFDPFTNTKSNKLTKGKGLNLPVSYQTIKRHNGFMTLKSVVGEGSKFIIDFGKH